MKNGERCARWSALGVIICAIPDFTDLASDMYFVVAIDKRGQWKYASARMRFEDAKKERSSMYKHHRKVAADRKARKRSKR